MHFSKIDPLILRRIIIDHYSNPENSGKPKNSAIYLEKFVKSEQCIDELTIYLHKDKNKVIDAKFKGVACSICISGTDIIFSQIKNKNIEKVKIIIKNYLKMISGEEFKKELIGEAICLHNTYKLPVRIKCASLGPKAILDLI